MSRMAVPAHERCAAAAGHLVAVERLRGLRQPGALGVHGEDASDHCSFGLVNHAMHVAVTVADVLAPEHAPARDGAGLGATTEGVVRALSGRGAVRSWRASS